MSKKRCKKCSRDLEYGNKKLCPICSHIQYTCKTKHHRLSSKSLSKMSIAQLKEYMKIYKETNGHIPYELKTDIEFQLLKEKEANKVFANKLIKSKWFSLGIAQTIRNKQAVRLLISENIIYELDTYDIIKNLLDVTEFANKKINFNFIDELNNISIHNQYIE